MGNLNMLRGTDRANRRSANREYAITDCIASRRLGFVESFAANAWSSVHTPRCLAELSLTTQPFRVGLSDRIFSQGAAIEHTHYVCTLELTELAGEASP